MHLKTLLAGLAVLMMVEGSVLPGGSGRSTRTCSQVPKPTYNPNLFCNVYGSMNEARISLLGSPTVIADAASCASVCKGTAGCISFGFSQSTTSCQMYGKSLRDMEMNATFTGDIIYYNHGCWMQSCSEIALPCVCTQTATGVCHLIRLFDMSFSANTVQST